MILNSFNKEVWFHFNNAKLKIENAKDKNGGDFRPRFKQRLNENEESDNIIFLKYVSNDNKEVWKRRKKGRIYKTKKKRSPTTTKSNAQ